MRPPFSSLASELGLQAYRLVRRVALAEQPPIICSAGDDQSSTSGLRSHGSRSAAHVRVPLAPSTAPHAPGIFTRPCSSSQAVRRRTARIDHTAPASKSSECSRLLITPRTRRNGLLDLQTSARRWIGNLRNHLEAGEMLRAPAPLCLPPTTCSLLHPPLRCGPARLRGLGARGWAFMDLRLPSLFDNPGGESSFDHAADLRAVRLLSSVVTAKRATCRALAGLMPIAERTWVIRNVDIATSDDVGLARGLRSQYAVDIPGIDTSSGVLPRRRAISSGRRSSTQTLRAVALDTLMRVRPATWRARRAHFACEDFASRRAATAIRSSGSRQAGSTARRVMLPVRRSGGVMVLARQSGWRHVLAHFLMPFWIAVSTFRDATPVTQPDVAAAVAHHDERGEREAPAALDDLGHAVDGDHSLFELAVGHVQSLGSWFRA